MTDSNYTHIFVLVDRSGSMLGMRKDMIGGLNSFFSAQAEVPGKCLVDYAQFDNEYELVFSDKEIDKASAQLEPRGATALLDSLGKSITSLGEKFKNMNEDQRPGKVIFVVVTDGYENASIEWDDTSVKQLVKTQTDQYNWDFVFLGANIDAVNVGSSYGFAGASSLTYSQANVGDTTNSLNNYVTRSRTFGSATFSDEDREAAVK